MSATLRITWWGTTRIRTKLAVMLVAAIVTGVTGCGGGDSGAPPAATTTTRQLEAAPAPDPTTPDGVAVAAIAAIYTWYPVTEQPGDSLNRARRWLGPSMLRVLDGSAGATETPRPTLQWAQWAKAKATVEAFTFASGEKPPGTADSGLAQYKIGIEQTVVYPDGRREALTPATVIATVVSTPEGWRLDAYR